MKTALPGTVISGTLRTEDLINAFVHFLNLHEHEQAERFRLIHETVSMEDWGEILLHEDLFPAMDELSPEGYYFDSHPGDGSDFGYWKEE